MPISDAERALWLHMNEHLGSKVTVVDSFDVSSSAFHLLCPKLNAAHLEQMQAPPQAVSSEARQLLCELRDTTQSRSTYDRCVAIVGERGA
jgi:hypothetical protein